jgi:hypothetical protein
MLFVLLLLLSALHASQNKASGPLTWQEIEVEHGCHAQLGGACSQQAQHANHERVTCSPNPAKAYIRKLPLLLQSPQT